MIHDAASRTRGRLVTRRGTETTAEADANARLEAKGTAERKAEADAKRKAERKAEAKRPVVRDGTWLATPADFDYTRTLGFLNPRTVPAMEVTTPALYVRTVWLEAGALRALAARVDRAAATTSAGAAEVEDAAFDFSGSITLAIAPAVSASAADAAGDHTSPSASAARRPAGRGRAAMLASRGMDEHAGDQADASAARGAGSAGLTIYSAPHLPDAVRRLLVTRMFDLDADLTAFVAAVSRDRVLGPLVRRQPPLRLPQVLDPFEGLVRAVLGQQVAVKAATTMVDRLVRRFGTPAPVLALPLSLSSPLPATADSPDEPDTPDALKAVKALEALPPPATQTTPLLAFPRPDVIAAAGEEALRSIGLTRAKAATLGRIAEAVCAGRLDCVSLRALQADEAQARLVALPGIGPWTASYVRMRALGDRDAFPLADLGVIKALDARGVPRDRHAAVAERWRPWRAYATLHLWESLAKPAAPRADD